MKKLMLSTAAVCLALPMACKTASPKGSDVKKIEVEGIPQLPLTKAELYERYSENREKLGSVGTTLGHDDDTRAYNALLMFTETSYHVGGEQTIIGAERIFQPMQPVMFSDDKFPVVYKKGDDTFAIADINARQIASHTVAVTLTKKLKRQVVDGDYQNTGYAAVSCQQQFLLQGDEITRFKGQDLNIFQMANAINAKDFEVQDLFLATYPQLKNPSLNGKYDDAVEMFSSANFRPYRPEVQESGSYFFTSCTFNLVPEREATSVWDKGDHYVVTVHGGETSLAGLLDSSILRGSTDISKEKGPINGRVKYGDDDFRILCEYDPQIGEDQTVCEFVLKK